VNKPPNFAPVFFLEWQEGLDQETLVAEGLQWLTRQPAGQRGVLATDSSSGLELVPRAVLGSLNSIHTRNTGIGTSAANLPILVLFPLRELLLKLAAHQLQGADAMCVLTYGPTDVPFVNHWLDRIGAVNLVNGFRREVSESSALDPVVEAAFSTLRDDLTGQLTGPQHDCDPNGIATMMELQRRGHELDADKLAAWASVQGYNEHEIVEFIGHVAKVKRNHGYNRKTLGTWTPNYERWLDFAADRAAHRE
jgi:hypothetical protein